MSLPHEFVQELRARLSISQVVGRKVLWDNRKSNQAKGDLWAPCPFHQEKTASFHVVEREGYYYCFGCHAKGDAISFVRETENVGFMEAVEILAGEVGMPMPARDPKAAQKADRNSVLAGVMEEAVKFYRLQLKTAAAAEARAYLDGRGLSPAARDRFEIGFAPDARDLLARHLAGKGIAEADLMEAGLTAEGRSGGAPYERFRGRILFPIRDARGRCIAFGGRALDPQARAKYLNSPETPLFDKGRNLYNLGPAREAAGKGAPLVVAEGYMDVIALSEAGFRATVAPLGTAVTESQLALMWRIHDEPVIALDGDTAGRRAALRLIDLALPMLKAGKGLRFALMPQGQDPDDVLRRDGPEAMQRLIEDARPMLSLLWERMTEGRVLDSPERRAALDKDLREALAKIADPSIRGHYGAEFRTLRARLFGWDGNGTGNGAGHWSGTAQGSFAEAPARFAGPRRAFAPGSKGDGWPGGSGGRARGAGWSPPAIPAAGTRRSLLALQAGDAEEMTLALREAVVLGALIRAPALLEEFVHVLEELEFSLPDHARIARALLACDPAATGPEVEAALLATLGPGPLERLFAPRHVHLAPPIRRPEDRAAARQCLLEEVAKIDAARRARQGTLEASAELAAIEMREGDEGAHETITWCLNDANQARFEVLRPAESAVSDYEVSDNGVRLDRGERSAFQAVLDALEASRRDSESR